MNKIPKDLIFMLCAVILITCSLVFVGYNASDTLWKHNPTEPIKNGYYVMTEDCWQKAQDKWDGVMGAFPARTEIIIYDNVLVKIDGNYERLYEFKLNGDHCTAQNVSDTIDFKLNGEILTIESQYFNRTDQLRFYPNVEFAMDEQPDKLLPPSDLKIRSDRGVITWKYRGEGLSPLFAAVEIKREGCMDFENVYRNKLCHG